MSSSRSKLRAIVAAEVNRPARPSSRSPLASANELATDLARPDRPCDPTCSRSLSLSPEIYTVLFSLRGERFSVTVPAKNYTDAKRLAWIDAREICEPSDYAALVLCQCSRTPPTP